MAYLRYNPGTIMPKFVSCVRYMKFWLRVKHALTRPRTPSHALSPPSPKNTRPLPAVRPPGVLPNVH